MSVLLSRRQAGLLAASAAIASGSAPRIARAAEPVKLGLVAALSGQSAKSGEGITRGLTIAIDELNAKGGVLGRPIELVRRDDESNPAKGQTAARELIDREGVAALFGGIDSPVSQAIVPIVNAAKMPFMGVWAAATNITRNGADPNYCFRVSAVDVLVDKRLIAHATGVMGMKKPGLLLVNNGWGESNNNGLTAAAAAAGVTLAGTEKFEDKDVDMAPQLQRLRAAGADGIILVGNAAPGAQVVKGMQRTAWTAPVVSHWGISGGRFPELAGTWASKVHFVQTYSFFGKQTPVGQKVVKALMAKYPDIKGVGDIVPPVGVANAYDAAMLLAMAIGAAGSTDGEKIRVALEGLGPYQGLIKAYDKPFTHANHDALDENDYVMVRYNGEQIEPVTGLMLASALAGALVTGLGLGSMYGLIALGFTLTFAVSGTVNFAQGSSVMLGAVAVHMLAVSAGWPMPAAIVAALVICAAWGLVVERIAIRPFVRRGSNAWLMATVALGIVIDNGVMAIFGKEPRALPSALADEPWIVAVPGAGDVGVFPLQLVVPFVGLALAALVHLALNRTGLGLRLRAAVQNADAARLMGVDVTRLVAVTFASAAALAGVAGILVAPLFNVAYDMGTLFGIKAFAVAIIGGLTRPWGVVAAGLLYGLVEAFSTTLLGSGSTAIVTFSCVIAALAFAPEGLFARRRTARV